MRVVNDITKKENRRRSLNDFLTKLFHQVDVRQPANVALKTRCQRLRQLPPDTFNTLLNDKDPKVPFVVVRDQQENAPTFEKTLYCALDWDLVQLMALWWFFFESVTGDPQTGNNSNPMLAVALTYLVERFLRWLRASLGESNLVTKTFTDDRFLN